MKYKISDLFITIDKNDYRIGVVLGEDGNPTSLRATEFIPISEYESGLKSFKYGTARINDLVFHSIGEYFTKGNAKKIDKKWIDELVLMGYDVSSVKYYLKGDD